MTWSVVSTMLGIPESVLPCVAHYLNSDAERVHVYLDAPHPQIEAALAEHPRCVVTVCDERYWSKKLGGRPGKLARQRANVEDARGHSESDWLLHIDSDEFVVPANFSEPLKLSRVLASVPNEQDWVRIRPVERVLSKAMRPLSIFEGIFRSSCNNPEVIAEAYGKSARFLHRGLSGHSRGKVAFRRLTKLRVRLHDVIYPPQPGDDLPVVVQDRDLPPHTGLDDFPLLHFDGWTPLHWTSKLIRLIEDGRQNKVRVASTRFIVNHPSASDRLALFDRVQRLPPRRLSILQKAGLIISAQFDPADLTRETFPGVDFDFSIGQFDARLRCADQAFFVRNNL